MAWVCPNNCETPYVIAHITEDLDPDRIGILVKRKNGEVTNRWTDGTVGITEEEAALANESEYVVCAECNDYCEWEHGPK